MPMRLQKFRVCVEDQCYLVLSLSLKRIKNQKADHGRVRIIPVILESVGNVGF